MIRGACEHGSHGDESMMQDITNVPIGKLEGALKELCAKAHMLNESVYIEHVGTHGKRIVARLAPLAFYTPFDVKG